MSNFSCETKVNIIFIFIYIFCRSTKNRIKQRPLKIRMATANQNLLQVNILLFFLFSLNKCIHMQLYMQALDCKSL